MMTTQTMVGGVPVSNLRRVLETTNDERLAIFLHGYALGFGADQFIAGMTQPNERVGFFIAMAGTYPEDWMKAIETGLHEANDELLTVIVRVLKGKGLI